MRLRPEDLERLPDEEFDLIQAYDDGDLGPAERRRAELLLRKPLHRKLLDLLRGLSALVQSEPPGPAAVSEPAFSFMGPPERPPSPAGLPDDWRARLRDLDPPLRQVPMPVSPRHQRMLDRRFRWQCAQDAFDDTERTVLNEYGRMLEALSSGELSPEIPAESHFLRTCLVNEPSVYDEERVWQKYVAERKRVANE